jgi:putative transposon-encoded protein
MVSGKLIMAFLALMWMCMLGGRVVAAQGLEADPKTPAPFLTEKHPKIGPGVLQALKRRQEGMASPDGWTLGSGAMDSRADSLQVYIELEAFDQGILAQLRAQGAVIEIVAPDRRLVQARLPLDRIEQVSRLPFVRFIRLPDYGFSNQQGAVGTEGDAVMRSAEVRQFLGVTGAGIRVGVISDGIGGLNQSIASGDLPPQGVSSRSFRADGNINAGAEGTAILEIIYDIAPGVVLFFANFATSLEFIQAVNWLAAEAGGPNPRRGTAGGVDIIVEDIAFFNTGAYDGSSPVSQALSNAVIQGVAVFASVGNQAQSHYQGIFTDTDGDTLHEFDVSLGQPRVDNAGETLNVTLQPGETVRIFLQWNDPFGASSNDYDLCASDPANIPTAVIFCSTARQDGNDNPTEFLIITRAAPTPGTLGVSIINVQGRAAPRLLDLFIVGGTMNEFIVPESSVPNAADSLLAVSVGAVDWRTAWVTEPFSSQGPTNDGRLKPELVAPDGVSVTGAGGFPTPFFGTSAAAPHAGAVAALMLSVNPTLSPGSLLAAMTAGADPLSSPSPNNVSGFGRVDAFTIFGPTMPVVGDYDGDGRSDLAVISPNLSVWYSLLNSTGQVETQQFGWSAAIPVPADYDGDGKVDLAVLDPFAFLWYILESSTGQQRLQQFGWSAARPVPADYDGDGKADLAVLDPFAFVWYIPESSTGQQRLQQFGWSAAIPVPADYDGDGKVDLAVLDPFAFLWYILESSTGQQRLQQFGWSAAVSLPADYDGDGQTDLAVLDPFAFVWFIRESSTGQVRTRQFGWSGTMPVPADYDGDGKVDLAVLDPFRFVWYILESSTGQVRSVPFGL